MAWFYNGKKYWYHNGKRYSRRVTNKRYKRAVKKFSNYSRNFKSEDDLNFSYLFENKNKLNYRTYKKYYNK